MKENEALEKMKRDKMQATLATAITLYTTLKRQNGQPLIRYDQCQQMAAAAVGIAYSASTAENLAEAESNPRSALDLIHSIERGALETARAVRKQDLQEEAEILKQVAEET